MTVPGKITAHAPLFVKLSVDYFFIFKAEDAVELKMFFLTARVVLTTSRFSIDFLGGRFLHLSLGGTANMTHTDGSRRSHLIIQLVFSASKMIIFRRKTCCTSESRPPASDLTLFKDR